MSLDNHNENKDRKINELNSLDSLSCYLKTQAGVREGRAIPPLDQWHPTAVGEMNLVIKANGEWWHEGSQVTRQSLVSLFATVLWKEEEGQTAQYYLKTPVQKLKISVEDVPLLINDVGVVQESGISWLEFTTFTGDVVRLDEAHPIELREYPTSHSDAVGAGEGSQVRPYMLVRDGLEALIGRNTFYHLTELGQLLEKDGKTVLILQSGGKSYTVAMPIDLE